MGRDEGGHEGDARGHGLFGEAWCASWRCAAVLLVACVLAFVPGLWRLPAIDRDESRFAQASRQMAESTTLAGWVVPRVQDRPRLNKPPLIYWVQAASVRAFTRDPGAGSSVRADAIWMYRVPSVVAGIATVMLVWGWGRWMSVGGRGAAGIGARAGALAASGVAVAPVFVWEAHQARADMVLVAWTVGAMWALHVVVARGRGGPDGGGARQGVRRAWPVAALWVCVAMGILTKGPITPMVVGFALIGVCVVSRSIEALRRIRPLVGMVVVVACVLPWVALVMAEVGAREYVALVHDEVIGRSLEPKEGHWGPPGYHTLMVFAVLAPLSLCVGVGVADAIARARRAVGRGLAAEGVGRLSAEGIGAVLMASAVLGSWVVFELVSTKLPHYTMPLLPLVAMLCGLVAHGEWARRLCARAWFRAFGVAYAVGMSCAVVMLGGGTALVLYRSDGGLLAHPVAVGLVGVLAVAGAVLVWRGVARALARGSVSGAMGVGVAAWGVCGSVLVATLGMLPDIGTSRELARVIAQVDPMGDREVLAAWYHEDSLVFETHGRAQRVSAEDVVARLAAHRAVQGSDTMGNARGPIVVVPREHVGGFDGLVERGVVRGFNYSRGKPVELVVAELADDAGRSGSARDAVPGAAGVEGSDQ